MPAKPRDPHAHAVHAPGPRLLRAVPLRFFRPRFSRRRGALATLGVVSLIDVLAVIVFFLIAQPQMASGECCIQKDVKTPWALHVEDLLDAPTVSVWQGVILVDGLHAGSARAIAASGRVQRIEDLRDILRNKRELWRQVLPDKPFPGTVVLEIDGDTPAVVVKSVFTTAVQAGYPNVSFMVRKLEPPL
jgi:biopolymer transport protein ExbD